MERPEATILLEDAPEFEFSRGVFYVTDAGGRRAMLLHIFLKAFHSAAKAIQEYHSAEGAAIIEFPRAAR